VAKFIILFIVLLGSSLLKAQVKFNGNFEQLDAKGNPVGWDLTFDHRNTFEVKLDSVIKKQGKFSVSISSEKSKDAASAINFPINHTFHGKTLILIGNIKTRDVTYGWAGLWLRVDGEDKKVLAFDNMQKSGVTGTNDWKEYMVQVPYNESEAITINAGALLVGKGKIWIDSLRLYLDEQPITQAPIISIASVAAKKDTAFKNGSGIDTVLISKKRVEYLNLLGQLWGFLKYYHPSIAKGEHNWDNELFRILPSVLKSRSNYQVSVLLERWVDRLGKPPVCKKCEPISKIKNVTNLPDYGNLFNNQVFSKNLTNKLRYLVANRNTGNHYYVELDTLAANNPQFTHERPYAKMIYPDAGYRLLALFRYWSMINYFYPNRELVKQGWSNLLPIYIQKFIRDKNKTAYARTIVELITCINDSHAFIQSDVFETFKGKYRLPFQARFIENKLVVTGYYKDTLDVRQKFKIGDIIATINGEPVNKLVNKYLLLTPASNYPGKLRDLPGNYLLRGNNPLFTIKLLRNNQLVAIKMKAIELSKTNFYVLDWNINPQKPAYSLLNKNIGYLFPGNYKVSELPAIKNEFKSTKGIIVDLRCYPSDELVFTMGNYLKPYSSPFVKFTAGSVNYPGMFYSTLEGNGENNSEHYKGKVVVIVNELTQSNAEFVTMAFQTAPNVTVIGSTTAGADGNISQIVLPGGFTTFISGLGVYYPDGICAQQKGVKINYVVKPTIKGIKAGRDELLEKAKKIINEN
jgi:hypothetical protein